VKWIEQLPGGKGRQQVLSRVIPKIAITLISDGKIEEATAIIEQLPEGRARDRAISRVAYLGPWKDSQEAVNWAQQHLKGEDKDRLMKELLKNRAGLLIQRDPKDALTFMARNFKGDDFSQSRLDFIHYLGEVESVEDMAKWMDEFPQFCGDFVRSSRRREARCEPSAALAHLEQLPSGEERQKASVDLVAGWAESDPSAALLWTEKSLEGEARARALYEIACNILLRDPQKAASLAESLPESEERAELLYKIARNSAETDPRRGPDWLKTLPSGPSRNKAFSGFASGLIRYSDAKTAIQWANTAIEDPIVRNEAIKSLAEEWLSIDGEAAMQWINQSSLPDETRKQLLDSKKDE